MDGPQDSRQGSRKSSPSQTPLAPPAASRGVPASGAPGSQPSCHLVAPLSPPEPIKRRQEPLSTPSQRPIHSQPEIQKNNTIENGHQVRQVKRRLHRSLAIRSVHAPTRLCPFGPDDSAQVQRRCIGDCPSLPKNLGGHGRVGTLGRQGANRLPHGASRTH